MTYKIIKVCLFTFSRLIWLCIIFFLVVHAVEFLAPSTDTDPQQFGLNIFLGEKGDISHFLARYWPTEILLTIFSFIVFEAVGSKSTYNLAAKISKKLHKEDHLEPLNFEIEIEAENCKPGLTAIEIKNDDKTPMEFVVKVLEEYFRFDREEAVKLMLEIHTNGNAKVQWIDTEKAIKVIENISREANKRSYPLKCNLLPA